MMCKNCGMENACSTDTKCWHCGKPLLAESPGSAVGDHAISDTPRTDAALHELQGSFWVPESVAQNLERELADLQAKFKDYKYNAECGVKWANETIALFRGRLEAAEKLNWMLPRDLAGA